MCEGYKKSFTKNLKKVLQFISTGLTNNHPRVRYAALFAFGLSLKNAAPKPQKELTNNFLPALELLLSNKEKSLRVKTQSCNFLVEFLRGIIKWRNFIGWSIKTIETMGFLCSSIAEDSKKYENDLQEISSVFLNYMQKLNEEDP